MTKTKKVNNIIQFPVYLYTTVVTEEGVEPTDKQCMLAILQDHGKEIGKGVDPDNIQVIDQDEYAGDEEEITGEIDF